MFKKAPVNVIVKIGTIRILSTAKDDLESYVRFVKETTGEETSLQEVAAYFIMKGIMEDKEFQKYQRESNKKNPNKEEKETEAKNSEPEKKKKE